MRLNISETLVRNLVNIQFPQWKHLPIHPVFCNGWDNKSFRLGSELLIRMPSAERYAVQVEKEQQWLPILAPKLPLAIPKPVAMGKPTADYPWKWSIYHWLEGDTISSIPVIDLADLAISLAKFLKVLQAIDSTDGPLPGPHNFFRGGLLSTYDIETRHAITALKDKIDADLAIDVWETALATSWKKPAVWIHGDISADNLLARNEKLSAVIDFGMLGIGDPACDLAITWTLFSGKTREVFQAMLPFDAGTWARGRAWTLWKAVIVASASLNAVNNADTAPWRVINEVLADYQR